jgi:hypothetical protein
MNQSSRIPDNVWKRRIDAENPSNSVHTFSRPPILEALSLLPLAYRVGSYLHEERRNGREPIFDLNGIGLEPPNPGPQSGVPCGGLVIIPLTLYPSFALIPSSNHYMSENEIPTLLDDFIS